MASVKLIGTPAAASAPGSRRAVCPDDPGSSRTIATMSGEPSTHLEGLLDRLQQGDEPARQELIGAAYERLRLLARRMLHREFPRLEHLHESASVVHRSAFRLLDALKEVRPDTERGFLKLAARQTRWVLLDLARQAKRDKTSGRGVYGPIDCPVTAEELEAWAKFHQAVEALPGDEREVFELIWYHGLTQAGAARLLKLHPEEVSRRWLRARLRLMDRVQDIDGLLRK